MKNHNKLKKDSLKKEKWLVDNKHALKQVSQGLDDASVGNVCEKGSFAKFVEDEENNMGYRIQHGTSERSDSNLPSIPDVCFFTKEEIKYVRRFLLDQIKRIEPRIVVSRSRFSTLLDCLIATKERMLRLREELKDYSSTKRELLSNDDIICLTEWFDDARKEIRRKFNELESDPEEAAEGGIAVAILSNLHIKLVILARFVGIKDFYNRNLEI